MSSPLWSLQIFKPNIVFIIGAGASCEFGLPLGGELTRNIIRNLAVDQGSGYSRGAHFIDRRAEDLLRVRYTDLPGTLDSAWNAAALIRGGILHAQSIDAFIDMHADKPEVATVGKLQIALEILRAERQSGLFVDRSNSYNRVRFEQADVSSSWLRTFTEILLEKAHSDDLQAIGRNVTIICFNYDRCIEHYLIDALEATLGISYAAAHEVVYRLNIIHPYGSLGPLPSSRGGRDGIDFGADVDNGGVDIWQIVDGLSTFTEEMRDQEQIAAIRAATDRIASYAWGLGSKFRTCSFLYRPSVRGHLTVPMQYPPASAFTKWQKARYVTVCVLSLETHRMTQTAKQS